MCGDGDDYTTGRPFDHDHDDCDECDNSNGDHDNDDDDLEKIKMLKSAKVSCTVHQTNGRPIDHDHDCDCDGDDYTTGPLDEDDNVMTMTAWRHIPTMTKSHHGGFLSVMILVGICQVTKSHHK